MQTIYLIRHAEPEGDFPKRYLGRTNPRLGASGIEATKALARSYTQCIGLPVVCSPLIRAKATAALAFPTSKLEVEPLAVEMSFGVLDGLLPDEAERLYPEAVSHLKTNSLDASPFGGENWSDLITRAGLLAGSFEDGVSKILVSHRYFLLALLSLMIANRSSVRFMKEFMKYAECLVLQRFSDGLWHEKTNQ